MNELVRHELDTAQHSALLALLDRCESADGHPALAEPERAAVARNDLGAQGRTVVLAYDDDGNDELVACAVLSPAIDGATAVHLAVDPAHRGGDRGAGVRADLVRIATNSTPGPVRLWRMRASDEDDVEAAALGFEHERDLLQMRVSLPLPPATVASARPLATRAFVPGRDDDEWLSVNNRAFAGHPEQGGWTPAQLRARVQAPWFDPEGFLVADSPDGKGLIGSCWTKVHRHSSPVLGEIYVISVSPDHQGEGWGRSLTVEGLEWLAGQGVMVGMLYTDAANEAALALYRSLGFTIDHVDRSYMLFGRER